MSKEELAIIWKLRRVLSGLDGQQALELLLERLKKTNEQHRVPHAGAEDHPEQRKRRRQRAQGRLTARDARPDPAAPGGAGRCSASSGSWVSYAGRCSWSRRRSERRPATCSAARSACGSSPAASASSPRSRCPPLAQRHRPGTANPDGLGLVAMVTVLLVVVAADGAVVARRQWSARHDARRLPGVVWLVRPRAPAVGMLLVARQTVLHGCHRVRELVVHGEIACGSGPGQAFTVPGGLSAHRPAGESRWRPRWGSCGWATGHVAGPGSAAGTSAPASCTRQRSADYAVVCLRAPSAWPSRVRCSTGFAGSGPVLPGRRPWSSWVNRCARRRGRPAGRRSCRASSWCRRGSR